MSPTTKPPTGNLYLQIWRDPIYGDLLFAHVNAQQWQTLTALAVFINNKGECYPSLNKLKQILGLNSVASVSRRILSLEKVRFKGEPLIIVSRKNKKAKKGKQVYSNNTYRINQQIITIFAPHPSLSIDRQRQMEELEKRKAKLFGSLNAGEQRNGDELTRRSF